MNLLLSCCLLLGALENHLRPLTTQSSPSKIEGIDFIYMINLDERPEKLTQTLAHLKPFGIVPSRVSAINGWKLPLSTFTDIGVKYDPHTMDHGFIGTVYRSFEGKVYMSHEMMEEPGTTYFAHLMSPGAVGCLLSHLSVLQDSYNAGYETIWVLEDDVHVLSDPKQLPSLLKKLDLIDPKWDILYTDRDPRGPGGEYIACMAVAPRPNFTHMSLSYYQYREQVSADFILTRSRYGTYSMILRRSAIKKILDFIKGHHVFLPYDLDVNYVPGIRLYTVSRDIISNRIDAVTDNATPNY